MDWKLNLKDMKVHFNVFMQHKVTCVYRVINSLLIISKTTQDYCYVKKRKNRSLGLDSWWETHVMGGKQLLEGISQLTVRTCIEKCFFLKKKKKKS